MPRVDVIAKVSQAFHQAEVEKHDKYPEGPVPRKGENSLAGAAPPPSPMAPPLCWFILLSASWRVL